MNLTRINAWSEAEAREQFQRCCGSTAWAEQMAARRPYADEADLLAVAQQIEQTMTPADWREAFAAHPRIGDRAALRAKFATTAAWSASEQAGVAEAAEEVVDALAEGNRAYEARFGWIFIVCAAGKSATEMLDLLRQRLANDPDEELRTAAAEQRKITRLRLERL
jgi:2-oxo-4-hydroxy-4-carboxy-5-ureidoimidazoline decarboxylase